MINALQCTGGEFCTCCAPGCDCGCSLECAVYRRQLQTRQSLTSEQVAILDHTANRATRGLFCGDSEDMQRLVALGLMKSAGRVAWCPDEYFRITSEGRVVLAGRAATAGGDA